MMLSADPEDAVDPALSYNQRSDDGTSPRLFVDGDGRWDCCIHLSFLSKVCYNHACAAEIERCTFICVEFAGVKIFRSVVLDMILT